jgi:hypothetical protein
MRHSSLLLFGAITIIHVALFAVANLGMIGELDLVRLLWSAFETDFFGAGFIQHSEGISQRLDTGGGDNGHWLM